MYKKSVCMSVPVLLAMLALLPSQASAYYGSEIEVSQQVSQVCPCRILSTSEVSATITNFGTASDTFFLSLSVPDGWSGFIKPEVTLASGEDADIDPLWISPPCGTLPGEYTVKLKAVSAMSGKEDREDVVIEVLRCHIAQIEASGFSACEGGTASSQAVLVNAGVMKDTFSLSASPAWVTVSPATVAAGEMGRASFTISASPPGGTYGRFNATIRAASQGTYAAAAKVIEIESERCNYFTASLVPPEDDVCLGESVAYHLNIDNMGTRDDRYLVTVPSWASAGQASVSVPAGARKTVEISASPVSAGEKKLAVYVSSAGYPTAVVPVEGVVSVRDCRAAAASIVPESAAVCAGSQASFTAAVENTGNVQTAYDARFFIGDSPSVRSVILKPGESQDMSIDLDAPAPGEYPVLLDVRIGNRTVASAAAGLSVSRCYAASMEIPASAGGVCQGDEAAVDVSVINTGTKKDSYVLTHPGGSEEFSLGPGEEKTLEASFTVGYPWGSESNATFSLKSGGGASVVRSMSVRTLGKSGCYAVSLAQAVPGTLEVQRSRGSAFKVMVKNAGARKDTYTLSLDGPEWAYLSAGKITLAPGGEGAVYVYVSPAYGTKDGNYTMSLTAESGKASGRLALDAVVAASFPGGTEVVSSGGAGLSGMILSGALTAQAAVLSLMAFLTAAIVLLRFAIFR